MKFHHERVSRSMAFEDFLRVIYPKQDKFRVAAAWLLKNAAANPEGLGGFELSKACGEKNISRATMQKVFTHLRAMGLVDRRSMRYFVSPEFSTAMRNIGDAWTKILRENHLDFDEARLKLNV